MTPFAWKCWIVCVLAFALDILATWHFRAIVKADMAPAVATLVAMHFLGLLNKIWLIDHPELVKRLLLTGATAAGAGVGCALVVMVDI